MNRPFINVIENVLVPSTVMLLDVNYDPLNEVVLESTLDDLMKDVR